MMADREVLCIPWIVFIINVYRLCGDGNGFDNPCLMTIVPMDVWNNWMLIKFVGMHVEQGGEQLCLISR